MYKAITPEDIYLISKIKEKYSFSNKNDNYKTIKKNTSNRVNKIKQKLAHQYRQRSR